MPLQVQPSVPVVVGAQSAVHAAIAAGSNYV